MADHGPPEGGSVINLGSVVSRIAPPDSAIYVATKSAVDGITRVLAQELGPGNIRVNSINPGAVETEGTHSAGISGGISSGRRCGRRRLAGSASRPTSLRSWCSWLQTMPVG
jgi:NAD(P)-dependent dehydrogenase (short-subunit alcohol dehydrogenase family)